jgi:lipoprotein-anchoring transpeptidase ErfK/SrfK
MIPVPTVARRRRGLLVSLACAVLVAGCSGSESGHGTAGGGGDGGAATSDSKPAAVSVQPADKSTDVAPGSPVVVTASNGTLKSVQVTDSAGKQVPGTLDAEHTTWTSSGALGFGTTYQVSVTAANADGRTSTSTSSFSTVAPKALAYDAIAPLAGQTVGVGYPIRVYFRSDSDDKPLSVQNKDEVLKHLRVTTVPQQAGGWHWFANDTELHWRPKEYWKPGTKVTVDVNLMGVDLGDGVFAKRSRQVAFSIGPEHVSIADTKTHRLKVYANGKLVKDFPAAMGKEVAGRYTHNGPHVVITKDRVKHMDSTTYGLALDAGGYQTDVEWATRISNNGEFVHAAPWSVQDQGVRNVSHGCVNLSPENAKWFFQFSHVGDVVEVTGSPVPYTQKDGDIYDWVVPWEEWTPSE